MDAMMMRERPSVRRTVGMVGYLWLMAALPTGTAVLLGPAGWVTDALRARGWQGAENLVMKGVILAFVIGSLMIALGLAAATLRSPRRGVRVGIPVFVTALCALALWGWMDPNRMMAAVAGGGQQGEAITSEKGAEFLFGAYPDKARLAELKKQGYTAVVSLQHPAVVPFEPVSIEQEKRHARALGIRFIHAPMLPWVSDNAAALATIRGLMETGKGKYYIHCGLGRDRTNVVRRLVEARGMKVATSGDLRQASTFADRMRAPTAAERDMQRGAPRELEPGVWLIPHPNPSELSGYMLAGQVRTVVLLLDPTDPVQRAWRDEEEAAFRTSSVAFIERPVAKGETERLAEIAAEVRALPHPVAVVAPRTPYSNGVAYRGTEAAVGFMQAYRMLGAPAPVAAAATAAR